MIKTDLKLNRMLMQEMGLTVGDNNRVVDVEDGEICCVGTKDVVAPEHKERATIEFDPINNPRLMTNLFMQFIDKLEKEESIDGCTTFGTYQVHGSNKNIARLVMSSGEVLESRPYKTEGFCYAELIRKLNGDENDDFTKFDNMNRKPPVGGYRR